MGRTMTPQHHARDVEGRTEVEKPEMSAWPYCTFCVDDGRGCVFRNLYQGYQPDQTNLRQCKVRYNQPTNHTASF